jgi:hypothetical protein
MFVLNDLLHSSTLQKGDRKSILRKLVRSNMVSPRSVRTATAKSSRVTSFAAKIREKNYDWIFTRERLEDADHLVVETLSGEQLGCFCGNFQVG